MFFFAVLVLALFVPAPLRAQSGASLQGRVFDESDAVIAHAAIRVSNQPTGFDRLVLADEQGRFHVAAIPAGIYRVTAEASGFRSELIEAMTFEVGRALVRDFRLAVGDRTETVLVSAELPLLDRASATVGHVVTANTVQEIPLNGRHFTDLGLLVPGSVAPSQTGFSTTPTRGVGALAINTAGNREEAVGFHVNGVSTNNLAFGSLMFQPPIASIREFKVDNSAFSAEFGHVSGAIVNIVTRSGNDRFHGEAFGFYRNSALDARNYFEFTSDEPHPFERNQFGGTLGGPVVPRRTFFFATYEGLRQEQGLDMNSLVLSDAQRAAAADPAIQKLIALVPRSNYTDAAGTPRFVGAAAALVHNDRWTADLRHKLGRDGTLHFFYGSQDVRAIEPGSNGHTIPGFGHVLVRNVGTLTVDETHTFGGRLLNEARFGRSYGAGTAIPGAELNPSEFGISNGVTRALALPQISVAGGLTFGGPATYPTGRDDTLYVFTDTLSYFSGRHAIKLGGEYRHFLNENFEEGAGSFNFPSVPAFLAGNANAFSIILGERRSHIDQRSVSGFVQDRLSVRSNLTVELGLRYEWHVTPTERDNQFVVFDQATASLLQVGVDLDEIHRQNNRNFEPRAGVVWSAANGRTVVRAAHAWAVDQPSTTAVRNTAANPPFARPLTASGSIPIGNALATTQTSGIAPATIDPLFRNASLRSFNVNSQQQLPGKLAMMAGYFGSRGKNLRITRNLNQPIDGVRPYAAVSTASRILPGTPLGNIMQVESSGFSSYDAVWVSFARRLSRGLQFETSYTFSESRDTNSLNSSGFAVQDSYDIPNQYGFSDFDAPHRFVLSATYELPFRGSWLTSGWQVAAIVQSQSGNPVNIVTSNSVLNGVPNTVRPDLTGPIVITGTVDQWFDPSSFTAVNRFGNLPRNVVRGPAFHNTDVAVIKNINLRGAARMQLRADIFDLFNHANFGPPGNIVGSPTFGKITRTRLPTGEAGSSRQIQLAARVTF
jgi:hypothetical protein